MVRFGGLMVILLGFISCSKDPGTSSFPLDGAYAGVYLQSGDIKDTALLTLVFAGSGYSGTSMGGKRSICNGTYQISVDSINFTNACSVPDSTLLLAGKYKMTTAGDSLYFNRISNGIIYYQELFSLKKQ
jgi:hypothetical protein